MRRSIAIVFVLAIVGLYPPDTGAEEETEEAAPALSEAVIHVLDTEGGAVAGAEVVLIVERADGTLDRRLAVTDAEGTARFPDVRLDCRTLKAVVRRGDREIEGKPRSCGERPEAFVVVPEAAAAPAVPAPAGPAAPAAPEEEPASEGPPAPHEETVTVPEAEGPPEKAPEETAEEKPADVFQPPGMWEIAGRLGVDLCMSWFYNQSKDEMGCAQIDAVGFTAQGDFYLHLLDWLAVGLPIGYRLYGSSVPAAKVTEPSNENLPSGVVPYADGDTETNPSGASEEDKGKPDTTKGTDHLLSLGLGFRGSWTPGKWLLAAELAPLGLHFHILSAGADRTVSKDFFIQFGVLAGYYFLNNVYLGIYGQVFQPLPWINDTNYTGIVSFGLAVGTRFGSRRSLIER